MLHTTILNLRSSSPYSLVIHPSALEPEFLSYSPSSFILSSSPYSQRYGCLRLLFRLTWGLRPTEKRIWCPDSAPQLLQPAQINQSLNQSIIKSINLSIYQSINQSITRSINQSINYSINQSLNLSLNQSIYQSINLSIYQSINLSIYQSINQSMNQSSINQSNNKSIINWYIYHLSEIVRANCANMECILCYRLLLF